MSRTATTTAAAAPATAEPGPAEPGSAAPVVSVKAVAAAAVLEPGLDRPVRLIGARLSAAAVALVLVTGAGGAWAAFGTLPDTLPLNAVVAHGGAPVTVRAESAGALREVLVRPGEPVAAGRPVALLRTADGRESEVRAPAAGTVTAVRAEPGTALAPGSPVVTLDPAGEPAGVRLFATSTAELRALVPGRTVLVPVPGGGRLRAVVTAVDPMPARADSLDGTLPVPLPGLPTGAAPVWTAFAALPPGTVLPGGALPVTASVDLGARHPYQAVLGRGAAR